MAAAAAGAVAKAVLLAKAPALARFADEDFDDAAAMAYTSAVLGSGSAASATHQLSEGTQALEGALRAEVLSRHVELLQQVSRCGPRRSRRCAVVQTRDAPPCRSLRDTAGELAGLRAGVEALQAVMQRVRSEIAEPHRQIASRTRQLAALSGTVELLHTIIRFLKLVARLRETLVAGPGADLAKAAKTLSEIATLRAEADLAGVAVVDAEAQFLARAAADVSAEASSALQRGLEALSQSDVGAALQVFFNLGELPAAVERVASGYAKRASASVAEALDASKLPRAGGAVPAGAAAQDALWQRLDAAMERVHGAALAVWHLQRVLAKKRDPVAHTLFLDEVGTPVPFDRFWQALLRALTDQLARSYQAAGFVRDALVGGYPRLLGTLEALHARLLRDTDAREKGVPSAVRKGEATALSRVADPFQTAYLGRSLARITDAVTGPARTAPSAPPAPPAVARVCARVHDELVAAGGHADLCAAVAGGAAKALKLFVEKCEYACATGPEARQIAAPCTPAQARTLAAATALEAAHATLAPLLPALPPAAADALAPALAALHACASEAITPLFRAEAERCEACCLAMHGEAWGADTPSAEAGSAACADLVHALGHFQTEFLARLSPGLPRGAAGAPSRLLASQLATRVLVLFVRHAALLRPLSEAGKLRLTQAMAELELAVGAVAPMESLGAPFRALRPLLFLDTPAVASSPLLAELAPSVVLHHLLSRAPPELVSPHTRAGLSLNAYAAWLDGASEADVWRGIKGILDARPPGAPADEVCNALAAAGKRAE